MESLESSPAQELHLVNLRLAHELEIATKAIQDNDTESMTNRIRYLLADLSSGAVLIESSPSVGDHRAWKLQVTCYREYLLRIRKLLPEIHRSLSARRVKLDQERNHLRAASAWTAASRDQL
ncbi:MAG TPA: hypothetical protein VH437_11405 [Terriglobales bacterium]|jgi:hypothetical protein